MTPRIFIALAPVALLLAGCDESALAPGSASGAGPDGPTGATLYADYCASCHGDDVRGGTGGATRAADLTVLSKNNGGAFPAAYVMSTIDGYAREETHGPMPIFGELLGGELAVWEDEAGTPTPTPVALIRLADYLESLQR